MTKTYLCIDLKTFYASVECVERKKDPFSTDLIVADLSRNKGAICLAISPKMKARGIKNRCRIWQIPKYVKPIIAKPRMKKYIEYSARINLIYQKYVSKDDIHIYSIDESFLDVTSYLSLYKLTKEKLAEKIIKDVYDSTGICAACGIGTNLYLAKIALDIIAKNSSCNIGFLDEEKYIKKLWHYKPLTDFWGVGTHTEARLHKLHLNDMYDIAHANTKKLYKEFGINAQFLIDHANGIEPCTIKDIKSYKTKNKSMSNSQILFRDYDYKDAKKVLIEMIDSLTLDLIKKDLYTSSIGFTIGYSKDISLPLTFSKKLDNQTNSVDYISHILLSEYDYLISKNLPIRKISISFNNVGKKLYEQLNLFDDNLEQEKLKRLGNTINTLKDKYGKNAILRGVSLEEGTTQMIRNKLIGGHNAQ